MGAFEFSFLRVVGQRMPTTSDASAACRRVVDLLGLAFAAGVAGLGLQLVATCVAGGSLVVAQVGIAGQEAIQFIVACVAAGVAVAVADVAGARDGLVQASGADAVLLRMRKVGVVQRAGARDQQPSCQGDGRHDGISWLWLVPIAAI